MDYRSDDSGFEGRYMNNNQSKKRDGKIREGGDRDSFDRKARLRGGKNNKRRDNPRNRGWDY